MINADPDRTDAALDRDANNRALFDLIDDGFAVIELIADADGRTVDVLHVDANPAYERHTEIDGIVGKRASDVGLERGPWYDSYTEVARTGTAARIEVHIVAIDRWFSAHVSRIGGDGSRTLAVVFHDVTDRKRAEAALRESEQRYRALFESMDEAYAVVDVLKDEAGAWCDFRFVEVNQAFMIHTNMPYPVGQTATELLGSPNPNWTALYGQALDTGETLRVEESEATLGITFDLNVFTLDRERNRVAVLFTNITERKRAEAALRESEERFAQFAKSTTDVLWIRDARTMDLEYISPAFEQVFGVSAIDVKGGIEPGAALVDAEDRDRVTDHLDAVRRGEAQVYEFRIARQTDGAARWIRDHSFPLLDERGTVARIGGIARDVTAIKLADRSLRESEERQAFLLQLSDALRPLADPAEIMKTTSALLGSHLHVGRCGYGEIDATGAFLVVAREWTDGVMDSLAGTLRVDDFGDAFISAYRAGRTVVLDDVYADPRARGVEDAFEAIGGLRASLAVPLVKDGDWVAVFYVQQSTARHWTHDDETLVRDVAERTWAAVGRARAEAALRESEATREVAIAGGRMGTWRWNLAASTVEGDARFMALWGFPPTDEAMPLALFSDRMSPDGEAQTQTVVTSAIADNEEFDAEIEVASGPAAGRWLRWRGRAAPGDTSVLYGVSFDITEQKRAEAALRASETRLRDVLDSMTDGFALLGSDFAILDVNEETLRLDGRGRDELIGRTHWAAFPGSGALPIGQTLKRVMRDRVPAAIEHEYRWPDGRSLWIDARAYPTIEGGIAVFWRDITDRKQTEAALRDTQEQQQLMLQLAPALLWSADPAGHGITLNERWTEYTGQSKSETQNFGWLDAIHPDDLPATRAAFEHAFATGKPVEREHRVHKAGDGYRWHLVRHVPLRDDRGAIVRWFGAAIDIDELRRLQDLQKTLLAELQHRVRNILAVIRSMMRRSSETQDSLADYVQHLEGRISALARTQVLLTRSVDARVDLEDLIRDELLAQAADETKIGLLGPPVTLGPKAAEVLSLAIHELTTNAVKYGALSRVSATLQISWQVEERANAPWLHLTWSEVGVAVASSAPRREGFGSELITRRVPYELKGKGSLEMRPGGIVCELEFPLKDRASILQTDARTGEMVGSK